MEYRGVLEDIVHSETLREVRRRYEEDTNTGTPNERSQSQYGSCLVRCRSDVDITRGICLLKGLLQKTNDPQTERDCLYYLTTGYTNLEEYKDALACTTKLLQIEPYNRQFQEWRECFNRKIRNDTLITGQIMFGDAVIAVRGLGNTGQLLLSDKKATAAPKSPEIVSAPRPTYQHSVSEGEQTEALTNRLRDIHIGNELNQWQRSEVNYGNCDQEWILQLRSSPYVGDIDFGRKQWDRAWKAVDNVKSLLLSEMRTKALSKYKGLKIDSYILQGSARDGLKVIAPDEFDVGFEFHIEGIHLEECPIMKDNKPIPGFCYLKITDAPTTVEKKCPELWKKGVFITEKDVLYLSSKMLHRSVFQSLIDQCTLDIQQKVKEEGKFDFKITRKSNPPAVNITIEFDDEANAYFATPEAKKKPSSFTNCIDVDIIAALRLKTDGESECCKKMVNARIHAICKWKEEESAKALEMADQSLVWLVNSVAYERFVFDVARNDEKQQYILTALRILKTYMTKVKTGKVPPPQIGTVLQSYHLKQITCYLILYTCYVYPNTLIDGAKRALVFLIGLLDKCLDTGRLPHFFYSNSLIGKMFQKYPDVNCNPPLRFNLLRKLSQEAKLQALLSLRKELKIDLGINGEGPDKELSSVTEAFGREVAHGKYF